MLDIDLEKLYKHVVLEIGFNHRVHGKEKLISRPFRKCKLEDIVKTGIKIDEDYKVGIESRLCPDTDEFIDWYKVKNSYSNQTERNSFQITIRKCNPKIEKICDSDFKIEQVLNQLVWNLQTIYGQISLS